MKLHAILATYKWQNVPGMLFCLIRDGVSLCASQSKADVEAYAKQHGYTYHEEERFFTTELSR